MNDFLPVRVLQKLRGNAHFSLEMQIEMKSKTQSFPQHTDQDFCKKKNSAAESRAKPAFSHTMHVNANWYHLSGKQPGST